ncbi:MAG: hypothetical protein COW42_04760, partial [Deltaproteobacteria bacterium CG17_big_fil_post_rev_8_21_14_2_50_63_7]
AEASYHLGVTLIPPCVKFEDTFEENDEKAQAAALEAGTHELHICENDDDWFTFEAAPGDSFFMDLASLPDAVSKQTPILAYELYAEGTPGALRRGQIEPGAAQPLLNFELFEWPTKTRFHLLIKGFDELQEGPYGMTFYHFTACPEGDDAFEENDEPSASTELPAQEKLFRYLRHCDNDDDWYVATAAAPTNAGAAAPKDGEQVGLQATIEYDPRLGDL